MKKFFLIPVFILLASGCSQSGQSTLTAKVPPAADQPATSFQPSTPSIPKQRPIALLATINVSGSTNTLPYSLSIYSDGSIVAAARNEKSPGFPAKTADAGELLGLLDKAGNITNVKSSGECAKSASFGTVTTLTYNGQTSGDLQCVYGNPPSQYKNLADFINSIVNKAGIRAMRNPVTIPGT